MSSSPVFSANPLRRPGSPGQSRQRGPCLCPFGIYYSPRTLSLADHHRRDLVPSQRRDSPHANGLTGFREAWNMKKVAVFRPPAVFWAVWLDMPKSGLTVLVAERKRKNRLQTGQRLQAVKIGFPRISLVLGRTVLRLPNSTSFVIGVKRFLL